MNELAGAVIIVAVIFLIAMFIVLYGVWLDVMDGLRDAASQDDDPYEGQ